MKLTKFKSGILFLVISVFIQVNHAAVKIGKKFEPHGRHTTIIHFDNNDGVVIDQDLLEIFNHPEVAECKIVVYSIVGEFRKGKSFFMNYALRFMYANVSRKIILKK